ncbi:MAG TPA: hypothetical protein DIC60_04115 [Lachnospiraceae bacterium]|nr:hypothetical protein [Lachnospiraceae bacterium]
MPFRYNKLWDILNDRNLTKTDLRIMIGVSQTTIANMGKNNNVHLDVIDKICDCLHCTPNEIIDYYYDDKKEKKYSVGDIILVDFGETTEGFLSGVRPALVTGINEKFLYSSNLMVSPITTRKVKMNKSKYIMLDNNDGLKVEAFALLEHTKLVNQNMISVYIGHKELDSNDFKLLRDSMNELLLKYTEENHEDIKKTTEK